MESIIQVNNLVKKYGNLIAVDSISFNVQKGEIFGLLGENGAGKSTTLEMIEGLRRPTSGSISILGHNPTSEINMIKEKIGVQLQSSAYYEHLTLAEILDLFGGFYPKHLKSGELLAMVKLEAKAKSFVGKLSGGQKQRFSIVASLVNDPEVVFLDEPTTGLDPIARRNLWSLITTIRDQGKTVILTTHYMEEAEILCDRIAIMEKGKIVAMDQTHRLTASSKHPFKINFLVGKINKEIFQKLAELGKIRSILGKSDHFEMRLANQDNLNKSLKLLQDLNPDSFTVSRASLEDLFIELTGKSITQEENA